MYILYTHTGTHHWHSFPCGVGWGVIMFSPVQQECLTQVSHIYNMPALCLKLNLGTGSTQGHLGCFKGQNSEYRFNLEAFSYESRYKLAINSQRPTVEFSKLLRNLGKRLPSILSFVFCVFVFLFVCFLFFFFYGCCLLFNLKYF